MKTENLKSAISQTTYPGRGIILGKSPNGKFAVAAYFIMGRSENSRNRIFVEDGDGIRTQAFDASKMTDPSLIIYSPVRVWGNRTIVTNGDQTDTIYEGFENDLTFEQALRAREFENDAPNFTPRISVKLQGSGWPDFFEIRGEIVLPWAAFDKLNAEREAAGEPLFANPRNAAAGTLKLLNPAEVGRRGLDAYLYYLLGPDLPFDNHYDNMMAARSWGFKVSDAMTKLESIEQVDSFINYWDKARKELPVEIGRASCRERV